MSLWYAVVRDGAVLHFGKDRPVAAFAFTQNEGSALLSVQSLCELEKHLKGNQPEVSTQNVPETGPTCCGGSCGTGVRPGYVTAEDDLLNEVREGFDEGVRVVKETVAEALKRLGVTDEQLAEFTGKVQSGAEQVASNIKAGGEQAVERTKDLGQRAGKVLGGWFKSLGEKLEGQ